MTPPLRSGISTGGCAAAAVQGAALALLGTPPAAVELSFPDGTSTTLAIEDIGIIEAGKAAWASVRKDAGDDPDVTHGCLVIVHVRLRDDTAFTFAAGEGVGRVTKPGLQIPPGEAAINPVPRDMMCKAFQNVFPDKGADFLVSVPGGEEKAVHTFNPRLGIVGGISILGTSGRVVPRSEEAWLRSLFPQIDMAVAMGHHHVVVTPGSFGKALVGRMPNVASETIIHAGNFIGDILVACKERGVTKVLLAGHAGKLVKVAAGIFHTHSRMGDARLETVAALAGAAGASASLVERILNANTTEDAALLLQEEHLEHVWDLIAARAAQRASAHCGIPVDVVLTNYKGEWLGASHLPTPPAPDWRVVGVGPGSTPWICPEAWKILRKAQVLVGGARHLGALASAGQTTIPISATLENLATQLEPYHSSTVVFLASGDPGLFGLLAFLQRAWPEKKIAVTPGISSFALAAARLGVSWEDTRLASVHGRNLEALQAEVESHQRLFVLTDARHPPQAVAKMLIGTRCRMAILENLSYTEECLTEGIPEDLAHRTFAPLSVVSIDRSPE